MATLLLQVVGTAVGTFLGGPIGGAIGSAIGATAGNYIDRSLLAGGGKHYEGPRLSNLNGITAAEGAAIPRLYGRARLGGQVIWATALEEVATRQKVQSGGKGSPSTPTQTTYAYFANVAIGLCEGEIAFVRRVWADGKLIDLTKVTMRVYRGGEAQFPDPLIIAKEGRPDVPPYRGLAYVVFERLPLADYGNRLPVLSFEVVRPVDGLAKMVRAVDLIPGSTEFGYDTSPITQLAGFGVTRSENRNQMTHATDFQASLDALQALCPNLKSVALVVAWFGDDLRAGSCSIRPKVDLLGKATSGADWSVAGLTRATASEVSKVNGRAAFGGTPSDSAVLHAIADLKARGLSVMFYPFIMMDVPAGNGLTDPWSGAATQPAYPWRGRITCSPAPGVSGSADGTATGAAQVNAFFGTATAANFSAGLLPITVIIDYTGDIGDGIPVYSYQGSSIGYSGATEWSFRRLILHCAALAKAAGGVDAFLIGSEMVALTHVRAADGSFPAVGNFIALAAEVRTLLGAGTKIGYAADWTEYGAYVVGADVRFPLDPLWSNANIDFVGIDLYAPLTDWRDGRDHLDAALAHSTYDPDYLASRFRAGEAYDWYYANPADRNAQRRTPIADGAYGKPWVYRAKDITAWWSNAHVERIGGVERGTPTGWISKSKPIWLTEFGIPAVDKGANSPNVFPDPKSSESAYPPFSHQNRDDLIQARAIEALYRTFDPSHPLYVAGSNPTSPVYDGFMIDPDRIHLWTWDARPFPAFPHSQDIWADGSNWISGHWLTGRLEGVPLDRLIAAIVKDYGLGTASFIDVDGFVDGYLIDRPMAARAAIEPIATLSGVEAVASAGALRFVGRRSNAVLSIGPDDLAPDRNDILINRTRSQESELPHEVSINFTESSVDFRSISVSSRKLAGRSKRETRIEIAALMPRAEGQRLADTALQEAWISRDTIEFSLRPGLLALEIGDVVKIGDPGQQKLYRIARVTDGVARAIAARAVEPSIYDAAAGSSTLLSIAAAPTAGPAYALILDLPAARDTPTSLQYCAATASPWPGGLTIWRSADGGGYAPQATLARPATIGVTTTDLKAGPLWRWDRINCVTVRLSAGSLASVDPAAALGGSNTIALRGADGSWEILSFANAQLVAAGTYTLSMFVRGLKGSEAQASRLVAAGAPIVVLDDAIATIAAGTGDLGHSFTYRIAPSNRDYTDPSAIGLSAAVLPLALLPFSPVRLKAKHDVTGVTLSWIRRSRTDGDPWGTVEIPLGESQESYQVEILNGTSTLRTVTVTAPSYLYPSSTELADFGAARTSIHARIRQISSDVGPGQPLEDAVWIF